jgi:hypothetical protein
MPSPFERASAVELLPTTDETALTFRAHIPDGWQQGRGAFGGLVLGTLLRAMIAAEPDRARTPRTLTGDLAGPVLPGEALLHVRVVRRGANQTNVSARLEQGGVELASATTILSAPRASDARTLSPRPPPAKPFADVEVVPIGPPFGPVFAPHYEYRPTGPLPFSGAHEPITAGWVRERTAPDRLDAPGLTALLDAWWPALFSIDQGPRPMATVAFTAEYLHDPAALPAGAALLHTGRVHALAGGFFLELRELWWGDVLVALNQQTFAVLK